MFLDIISYIIGFKKGGGGGGDVDFATDAEAQAVLDAIFNNRGE